MIAQRAHCAISPEVYLSREKDIGSVSMLAQAELDSFCVSGRAH